MFVTKGIVARGVCSRCWVLSRARVEERVAWVGERARLVEWRDRGHGREFSQGLRTAEGGNDTLIEREEKQDIERSASSQTFDDSAATTATQPPPPPNQPSSALPWYLQHQTNLPPPQEIAQLPPLPPLPPPLLSPILEYLSITAGLDSLTLLDLRHLDPPPALGSKLLMLFCTARSEKHLHVSADRFCRFLRREHKLKASAAGLLGRNELKIKMRRKAKRARIMANVGVLAQREGGDVDDGIRTGWICVTLSKVEAHPEDVDDSAQRDGFVGFRHGKPGVNIVVQMFTEEKRGEIDLEALWSGVLRGQRRREEGADEALRRLVDGEGFEEWEEDRGSVSDAGDVVIEEKREARVERARRPSSRIVSDVFPPASRDFRAR